MMFPVASVSRPALGPTQPPVQWAPGVLSPGVKARPVPCRKILRHVKELLKSHGTNRQNYHFLSPIC
jgi:hypothetical protein